MSKVAGVAVLFSAGSISQASTTASLFEPYGDHGREHDERAVEAHGHLMLVLFRDGPAS